MPGDRYAVGRYNLVCAADFCNHLCRTYAFGAGVGGC